MAKNRDRKKKHQVPSAAATAARPAKIPRVGEDVDFRKCKPAWSFALLDPYAQYGGCIKLRRDQVDELLRRFRVWEKMTWEEILSEGWKQNHFIDVARCIPEAQERLAFLNLDDLEQLLSLRVNATGRVYGVLDRGIYQILWWDPNHEICPVPLKHT